MTSEPRKTVTSSRRRPLLPLAALLLPMLLAASNAHGQAAPDAAEEGVTRANGSMLRLNFQDASINTVLDELSAAAGFIVVKEVTPEGRVTLVSRQPISPAEAVVLLNTVLHQSGYAAIEQGRVLKIVERERAKHANIPVRLGADPSQIPQTDQLVTQVIPLRYASATQLHEDLTPLINPEADFAANASSNALVITDTSANIRRVVQIVQALDTSLASSVDVRVFPLTYARAADAAELINTVFENSEPVGDQEGDDNDNDNRRRGRFPPWLRQQMEQSNQRGNRVNAAADERTNTVVVTGPTDSLAVVERVLRELDANPADEVAVFVYPLRNAQALNAEIVLNGLFNGTTVTGSRASNSQTLQNLRRPAGTTTTTSGFPTGALNTSTTQLGQVSGRYGGTPTGGAGANRNLSREALQTASDLFGQVIIIADPDTNSLMVRTAPKNYDRVRAVIDEMDRPLPQVLIKVLIAEVTHDNELDFGFEFSALNLRASGQGQTAGTDFNLAAQDGGLIVQVLESDFTATLRALEEDGKLEVLSRPYILASDNQLASITVGQEVPFITNTRITETGQTINTIEYSDIGILLDVIPHINQEGLVILDVAPEISALTGTTVPISETVDAPVFAKRSALSRVAVPSGRTVVIGGLMEDRKTETISKVPLLGDIPVLGHLFKRTQITGAKTELLIFLTPHVAASPDVLEEMAEDERAGTILVPDAVRPGAFQEHERGLQRGKVLRPQTEPEPEPDTPAPAPPPANIESAIE